MSEGRAVEGRKEAVTFMVGAGVGGCGCGGAVEARPERVGGVL